MSDNNQKKNEGEKRRIYVISMPSSESENLLLQGTLLEQQDSSFEAMSEREDDLHEMKSSSENYFVKLLQSELKQNLNPLISELKSEVPTVVAIYSQSLVKEIWKGFLEALGLSEIEDSKKDS